MTLTLHRREGKIRARSLSVPMDFTGATSEEKSDVTIDEYQKKIREVMGYSESGARKRYQRHKKNGWIESNQRQQTTRVWLAFKLPEEFNLLGDLDVPVSLAYQEIVRKIETRGKNSGGDRDTVSPRTPRIKLQREISGIYFKDDE